MVFIQKYKLQIILEIIIALAVLFFIGNRMEKLVFLRTSYNLRTAGTDKLGHKIVYISEIQNRTFLDERSELLACIRRAKPDVIIITGGLLSGYDTDSDALIDFAGEASNIAPIYFISGNYESVKDFYPVVKAMLGANVEYDDRTLVTYRNSDRLYMLGLLGSSSVAFDNKWFYSFIDASLKSADKTCKSICFRESVFISIYPYTYLDFNFAKRTFSKQVRVPCIVSVVSEHKYSDDPCAEKERGVAIPFLAVSRQEINVITLR